MAEIKQESKKYFKFNFIVIIAMLSLIPLNLAFCGLIKTFYIQMALGIVGCAGLPLWALIIDVGAAYNGSTIKYMLFILAEALISAYPFFLCYGSFSFRAQYFFSLGFTAFVYFGTILLLDKFKDKTLKLVTVVTVLLFMLFVLRSDWALAVIPGFIVYFYKNKFSKLAYYIISFALVFFFVGLYMYVTASPDADKSEYIHMMSLIGTCGSLPFIKNFSFEREERPIQFIPYIFYPLILLALYLLKGIV